MTPSEAVALLERHRHLWPEWAVDVAANDPWGVSISAANGRWFGVDLYGGWLMAIRARVRPGLPDEENVRRILAAAEKGYRQRLRQVERQRERKPMQRKSKLKPNRERKAKRFEEDFGGKDRVLWGQARPCDTCGAQPPSQNSHVLSRGGRLGKAREVISQCQVCHDAITSMDTAELLEIADRVYREWLAQGGYELPSGLERHGESRTGFAGGS